MVTTQKAFSISVPITFPATGAGVVTPDVSQFGSLNCNNDFLVIPGGFNLGNPAGVPNMAFDRYCGERLNALPGNTASTTVCSKFQQLLICTRFKFECFLLCAISYDDAVENLLQNQS